MSDVKSCLAWATEELERVGVPNPGLDAELLLGHTLRMPCIELLLNPHRSLERQEFTHFERLVKMRQRRMPLSYVTGEAAFRYLTLKVTPDVLIPRPETECVVEEVVRLAGGLKEPKILDIGTGSGAIALSVVYEVEEAEVMATDISCEALAVARLNAQKYHLQACPERSRRNRVNFIQSDLFVNLPTKFKGYFNIIVSNPPYVLLSQLDQLEPEISRYEPRLALSSSEDGLYFHRLIAKEAPAYLRTGSYVIMEIGVRAGEKALELFKGLPGYRDIEILPDLSGHDRIIKARWHSS